MTALTEGLNAPHSYKSRRSYFPVAAATTIYGGAEVAILNGYLVPAGNTAGHMPVGRAAGDADNSAGAAGAINCEIDIGVFRWHNDATNPCVAADVGKPCYVVDDNVVANVAGTAGVIAGAIERVDTDGVWVLVPELGSILQNAAIETVTTAAISVLTRTSLLSVTGTQALTLADGLFEGQRKTLRCIVAASTPAGTLTPVTFADGTTVLFNAVEESIELEWHESGGWRAVLVVGATIA